MNPERIRVAIVDDHPALRDGTSVLLERQPDIEVVASVGTLAAAWQLVGAEVPPDVVVLDIRLTDERGLELLKRLADESRIRTAVVVWTGFDIPQYESYAFRTGAAGFVLKTAPVRELVDAIRTAAAGRLHFDRSAMQERDSMSPREREVLSHVIAGRSNDEIAAAMGITSRAVESHLTHLYRRHDVESRTELATRAVQEGWLDLPEP